MRTGLYVGEFHSLLISLSSLILKRGDTMCWSLLSEFTEWLRVRETEAFYKDFEFELDLILNSKLKNN